MPDTPSQPTVPAAGQILARPPRGDIATRFKPGHIGNPNGNGGWVGGRQKALRILDKMLAKEENQVLLAQDLEKTFRANPTSFFKNIVMPLLPQGVMLATTDAEGKAVRWTSLLSTVPEAPPEAPAPIDVDEVPDFTEKATPPQEGPPP